MTLTVEQLERISVAMEHGKDVCLGGHPPTARKLLDAASFVEAELRRRKHGPFTLAEARVSGKLYRRPHWPSGCYYILQDADESSHMAFAECINNKKPVAYDEDRMDRKVFADDIAATDYCLATEDGDK